jgi:hypothetical protein
MDRGSMVSAMMSNHKEKFKRWAQRLGMAAATLDAVHLGVGVMALLSGDPNAPGLLELMSGGGSLAAAILMQIGDRSGTDRGGDQQQAAAPQIAAQLPASAEQAPVSCSNSSPHDETTT